MNQIVILNNKQCQLTLDNNEVFEEIYHLISFKLEGVEYTPAYKTGRWNGITHLMTKKGLFPLGLLDTVQNKLQELNIEIIIDDKRPALNIISELDIAQQLQKIDKIPREHQIHIVEAAMQHRKGIIRSATGSGKSLVAALITAKLNRPTIIYVIGLDLLKQFHDLFSSIFEEKIGYIGNGVCDMQRINIVSVWTIGRALGLQGSKILDDETEEEQFSDSHTHKIVEMLKTTQVHIFDESHIITTDTIKNIHQIIDPIFIYGMSGTPFRDDNSDLLITGILGPQIIDVPASELIAKGLLVQPIIKFVDVPKHNLFKDNYHGVYKKYIVENMVRNALIVREVKDLVIKKYKILVLYKQIAHGRILLGLFQQNQLKCEMLNGQDTLERRTQVKEMITDGTIDIILVSTIFDLGVDIACLNGLILAGSGKSSIRALQRIGRVIRPFPNKKWAAVVDFNDQTKFLKKHSLRRYEVYCSEKGFKVFKSKEMA